MKDVKILFEEAQKSIDSEKFRKYVEHVLKEKDRMWRLDHLTDETVDRFIISLNDDEDSSGSSVAI